MGFQINTNISAVKAYNNLADTNAKTEKAEIHLATEKRIKPVDNDTSRLNVGKSINPKVQLMQTAKGDVSSSKDMFATAESQLISVKVMLSEIKAKQSDAENLSAGTIAALDTSDFETAIDNALGSVGNSVQKLDEQDNILTSAIANSQASASRLVDAEMAAEQLNETKASIEGDAATAMHAQLNMSPQQVLQLLNG